MQEDRTPDDGGSVSVREAAALANVSSQAVHKWIAQGRVQSHQADDGYRIDIEELAQFLALRRAAASVGINVATLLQWNEETGAPA
jgi:excisionase family DNA binding protein